MEPDPDPTPPTLEITILQHDPSIPFPQQWFPLYQDFPQINTAHLHQVDSEFLACQQLLAPLPFPGPPPKGSLKRTKRTLIRYKHLLNIIPRALAFLRDLQNPEDPNPILDKAPHPVSPAILIQNIESFRSHLISQQGSLLEIAASRFPDEIFQRIQHDLNIAPNLPPLANGSATSY